MGNGLVFGDFSKLAVESFNRICNVNQAAYCLWILEIGGRGCLYGLF